MKASEVEELAKLLKTKEEVEDVLKSNVHSKNPFSLQWTDTKAVRNVGLDEALRADWHKKKVKMAKAFLQLINKQISIEKKRLKIKEG